MSVLGSFCGRCGSIGGTAEAVGQKSYLLSSGKWYQVDEDFVASVDSIVRTIPAHLSAIHEKARRQRRLKRRLARGKRAPAAAPEAARMQPKP